MRGPPRNRMDFRFSPQEEAFRQEFRHWLTEDLPQNWQGGRFQARPARDGDDYIINGQKIWTSGAHYADWMILLARTDPEAPKHKGISYFLLEMKTPGVSTRPLIDMMNNHAFNEVFFENVRVPRDYLLGEEN